MTSEKITTLNMAPGVFGRDDSSAKWSETGNGDKFWGNNFHHAKAASLDSIEVTNMETGTTITLGSFSGHDYTRVSGASQLFYGVDPNSGLLSSNSSSAKCFQVYDQHQHSISAGCFIGTLTGHEENTKARWLRDVIGCQFQWTDKNTSRENNDGLKLISLYLMYMDSQYGIMQFAPVVNGGWSGDHHVIGDDPTAKFWGGKVAGTPMDQVDGKSTFSTKGAGTSGFGIGSAIQHNGRVVAYVSDKCVDIIQSNNMFCVGMWWSTLPSGDQMSVYDRIWDIFSFKLLTQKQQGFSANSKMIIPPSRTMNEAMFDDQFPIASPPVV